uniref:Uncharacterized protein n=1 Tax=Spongospora subterranea TaxID=70186 RepID=A0A0H5RF41_9EUKA|eukprot:CRZ12326.1 hypothetical protein [Spongospora subterranea]
MILFQLRYLDVVCNEKQLCEKLLDLLRVCPVLLQREILIAIPDIVTDSSHPVNNNENFLHYDNLMDQRLVEFLQELLNLSSDLMVLFANHSWLMGNGCYLMNTTQLRNVLLTQLLILVSGRSSWNCGACP